MAAFVCLGLSQPLLDLVARHPEFLGAVGLRGAALVGLGLGVAWLPPMVLALPAVLALRARRPGRFARLVAGSALFVALAISGLGLAARVTGETWFAAVASLAVAAMGFTMYRKLAGARFFASVLALVLVLAPAVFFTSKGVSSRLSQTESEPAPPVAVPQPVFILLFDEFPGWLAMTPELEIDAERFPNLAGFAATSDHFPMAFASAASTARSVPSLLAGVHLLDVGSPRSTTCNVFPRLATSYDLTANELVTDFAPRTAQSLDEAHGVLSINRDLAWIYLHWLLPARAAATLPSIDGRWTDFGVDPETDLSAGEILGGSGAVEVIDVTMPRFARFLRAIGTRDEGRPDFVFHHCIVPHYPWRLLPSGQTYSPVVYPSERESFYGDAWWALEGRARKDLNSQAVDTLLGRFFERLNETGQFDSSWVIVLSDHGTAFAPGYRARSISYEHLPTVLSVPLLVKRPGQTEARRFEQLVELVDVVPTLSEELGFELPCPPDGQSLYETPHRTYDDSLFAGLYGHAEGSLEEIETLLRHEALRHRISLGFEDPAAGNEMVRVRDELPIRPEWIATSPYGLGPYGSLLGSEVPPDAPTLPYQLELEPLDPNAIVDPGAPVVPAARLFGAFHGAPEGEHVDLVLAQGRRIVSTTRSRERVGAEVFSGMADPSLLRAGPLNLGAYAVRGSPEAPEFFRLEVLDQGGRAREVLAGAGRVLLAQGGIHGFDRLKRSGGASLREADGELHIEATDANPMLIFETEPIESRRIVVEIDLTVNRHTETQVWFQSEHIPSFNMQQVRIAPVEEGRNHEVIEVGTDSNLLRELRIDPGIGQGNYIVHSVTVRTMDRTETQ